MLKSNVLSRKCLPSLLKRRVSPHINRNAYIIDFLVQKSDKYLLRIYTLFICIYSLNLILGIPSSCLFH